MLVNEGPSSAHSTFIMALFRQHSNYPLIHPSPSLVGDSLKARDPVGFVSVVYKPLIAPEYLPIFCLIYATL